VNRYAVNKVLFDVYRDAGNADAFTTGPEDFLASYGLTPQEAAALVGRDLRWLVAEGAHPFLVFNFALSLAGGFSLPFCLAYVKELEGLEVGDITT
jgi:hypothetical protein